MKNIYAKKCLLSLLVLVFICLVIIPKAFVAGNPDITLLKSRNQDISLDSLHSSQQTNKEGKIPNIRAYIKDALRNVDFQKEVAELLNECEGAIQCWLEKLRIKLPPINMDLSGIIVDVTDLYCTHVLLASVDSKSNMPPFPEPEDTAHFWVSPKGIGLQCDGMIHYKMTQWPFLADFAHMTIDVSDTDASLDVYVLTKDGYTASGVRQGDCSIKTKIDINFDGSVSALILQLIRQPMIDFFTQMVEGEFCNITAEIIGTNLSQLIVDINEAIKPTLVPPVPLPPVDEHADKLSIPFARMEFYRFIDTLINGDEHTKGLLTNMDPINCIIALFTDDGAITIPLYNKDDPDSTPPEIKFDLLGIADISIKLPEAQLAFLTTFKEMHVLHSPKDTSYDVENGFEMHRLQTSLIVHLDVTAHDPDKKDDDDQDDKDDNDGDDDDPTPPVEPNVLHEEFTITVDLLRPKIEVDARPVVNKHRLPEVRMGGLWASNDSFLSCLLSLFDGTWNHGGGLRFSKLLVKSLLAVSMSSNNPDAPLERDIDNLVRRFILMMSQRFSTLLQDVLYGATNNVLRTLINEELEKAAATSVDQCAAMTPDIPPDAPSAPVVWKDSGLINLLQSLIKDVIKGPRGLNDWLSCAWTGGSVGPDFDFDHPIIPDQDETRRELQRRFDEFKRRMIEQDTVDNPPLFEVYDRTIRGLNSFFMFDFFRPYDTDEPDGDDKIAHHVLSKVGSQNLATQGVSGYQSISALHSGMQSGETITHNGDDDDDDKSYPREHRLWAELGIGHRPEKSVDVCQSTAFPMASSASHSHEIRTCTPYTSYRDRLKFDDENDEQMSRQYTADVSDTRQSSTVSKAPLSSAAILSLIKSLSPMIDEQSIDWDHIQAEREGTMHDLEKLQATLDSIKSLTTLLQARFDTEVSSGSSRSSTDEPVSQDTAAVVKKFLDLTQYLQEHYPDYVETSSHTLDDEEVRQLYQSIGGGLVHPSMDTVLSTINIGTSIVDGDDDDPADYTGPFRLWLAMAVPVGARLVAFNTTVVVDKFLAELDVFAQIDNNRFKNLSISQAFSLCLPSVIDRANVTSFNSKLDSLSFVFDLLLDPRGNLMHYDRRGPEFVEYINDQLSKAQPLMQNVTSLVVDKLVWASSYACRGEAVPGLPSLAENLSHSLVEWIAVAALGGVVIAFILYSFILLSTKEGTKQWAAVFCRYGHGGDKGFLVIKEKKKAIKSDSSQGSYSLTIPSTSVMSTSEYSHDFGPMSIPDEMSYGVVNFESYQTLANKASGSSQTRLDGTQQQQGSSYAPPGLPTKSVDDDHAHRGKQQPSQTQYYNGLAVHEINDDGLPQSASSFHINAQSRLAYNNPPQIDYPADHNHQNRQRRGSFSAASIGSSSSFRSVNSFASYRSTSTTLTNKEFYQQQKKLRRDKNILNVNHLALESGVSVDMLTGSSLLDSPTLPFLVRYLVVVALLFNVLLFIVSNMSVGAGVTVVLKLFGSRYDLGTVFSFTLISTVRDMWNARVYVLFLLVGTFSGFLPYFKLFLMLACWSLPQHKISIKWREFILIWLDRIGKWALIDGFVLALMVVAFRFNMPILGQHVVVDIIVRSDPGFYFFLFATMMSLALSHIILALHRHSLTPYVIEKGGPRISMWRHYFTLFNVRIGHPVLNDLPQCTEREEIRERNRELQRKQRKERQMKTMGRGIDIVQSPFDAHQGDGTQQRYAIIPFTNSATGPAQPLSHTAHRMASGNQQHVMTTNTSVLESGSHVSSTADSLHSDNSSNIFFRDDPDNETKSILSEDVYSIKAQCTLFGRYTFITLVLTTICVLAYGCYVDTFQFYFGGMAGWVVGDEKARRLYSLLSVGQSIADSSRDPNSVGIRWIQVVYFAFTIFVPFTYCFLMVILYIVPLSLHTHKALHVLGEVFFAWSGIDVFIVSVLAAVFEISSFAHTMMGNQCDELLPFIEEYMIDALADGKASCFDVKASYEMGAVYLIVSAIFFLIVGQAISMMSASALHDRAGKYYRLIQHAVYQQIIFVAKNIRLIDDGHGVGGSAHPQSTTLQSPSGGNGNTNSNNAKEPLLNASNADSDTYHHQTSSQPHISASYPAPPSLSGSSINQSIHSNDEMIVAMVQQIKQEQSPVIENTAKLPWWYKFLRFLERVKILTLSKQEVSVDPYGWDRTAMQHALNQSTLVNEGDVAAVEDLLAQHDTLIQRQQQQRQEFMKNSQQQQYPYQHDAHNAWDPHGDGYTPPPQKDSDGNHADDDFDQMIAL